MCLTLIVECADGIVYDTVGGEALCFGQQTQQRGDLQSHRVICLLGELNTVSCRIMCSFLYTLA